MLTALVLSALLRPQTVTFTHPCAHSSVVLEALGKELGLELKPLGSVNKDFIVVSFKDAAPEVVLKRLAQTLNAQWTEKSGVRYLQRTPAQEAQEFEREYSEKSAALRRAIKEVSQAALGGASAEALATRVRDFGDAKTQERWNAYQPIAKQLPAHKAMVALAGLLDIDDIVRGTQRKYEFSNYEFSEAPLPRGADI